MTVKLEIVNLRKGFKRRDGSSLEVIKDVSLSVAPHEFCCLLGPSGCGKSTILNILAGVVEPDAGDIRIDGAARSTARVRVGYVFQKPRLLAWKTVKDNVKFALKSMGFPKEEWEKRAGHNLELVGLGEFMDEYPLALSGGMQQRVGIARALSIDPDVLLMDEPFSHLDELTARTMRKELLQIWRQEKKTVLFVTHNALEAVYLADRVFLMGPRPTTVLDCVPVPVGRPREMEDPDLLQLQRYVVEALGVK